ncbi:MAG TPA: GLUG motif-containing protein [Rhizomicrobium sp.]|jgi:hypothetical protein|nr:GLUG motif-containing protein [Rhizomicrobium sp.]
MSRCLLLASIALLALAAQARASVVISSAPTLNVNCTGGVCTSTAKKAVLNATDLANMLASGDVTVKTGAGAVSILVTQSFSWASTSRLTLDAMQTVSFKAPATVAGPGSVTISTNDGGSGADLLFSGGASLAFWDMSSGLVVNGTSYTLVNDIATLASDIAANPSGAYALAKDYDASADGTYAHSPVATDFSGTFEGLGHAISNLTESVGLDVYAGLFAQTGTGAVLRDTVLDRVSIRDGQKAGTLVGANAGAILNCSVGGTIGSSDFPQVIGGLAGTSTGQIVNSHAAVTVSGSPGAGGVVGGLVGYAAVSNSAIVNSDASGDVSGGYYAGGLAGLVDNSATIVQSHATGNVSGSTLVGGLAGESSSAGLSADFASGNVTSSGKRGRTGGLVGFVFGGTIANSYATGAVTSTAPAHVGGLVGEAWGGSFGDSFATGAISGPSDTTDGGFAGAFRKSTVADDYWDVTTSGETNGAGRCGVECRHDPRGLTTAQFQSGLPAGFDRSIWRENPAINNGYPYLLANPPPR